MYETSYKIRTKRKKKGGKKGDQTDLERSDKQHLFSTSL